MLKHPALAQLVERRTVVCEQTSLGRWFESGKPDFFFLLREIYDNILNMKHITSDNVWHKLKFSLESFAISGDELGAGISYGLNNGSVPWIREVLNKIIDWSDMSNRSLNKEAKHRYHCKPSCINKNP